MSRLSDALEAHFQETGQVLFIPMGEECREDDLGCGAKVSVRTLKDCLERFHIADDCEMMVSGSPEIVRLLKRFRVDSSEPHLYQPGSRVL